MDERNSRRIGSTVDGVQEECHAKDAKLAKKNENGVANIGPFGCGLAALCSSASCELSKGQTLRHDGVSLARQ